MKIVNLTPHTVNIEGGMSYPPSGQVARVSCSQKAIGVLPDGTPLSRCEYGDVEGLPTHPEEGTMYIVSRLVLAASEWDVQRNDLLVPSDLVRDEEGRVIGCRSFEQLDQDR